MRFSFVAAAALAAVPSSVNGLIAARLAPTGMAKPWDNSTDIAWITQTVTAYKTYCPTATKFTKGTKTYTATQQTWVTVTDCPKKCTISYQPSKPSIIPVVPVPKPAPAPAKNGTVPVIPAKP